MSGPFVVVSIVEGHGEVEALPVLLRRLVERLDPDRAVEVHRPIRVARDKLVKHGELERYVELAARGAGDDGAVLVLVDADDDCPATLGPQLLDRAKAVRSTIPVAVVLAMREFEGWFLAAAPSLAGKRGLSEDLTAPEAPETIRDAKGWLQARRIDKFAYSPTADQPALTAAMDLDMARNGAPSFDKLWRDVERLLAETLP